MASYIDFRDVVCDGQNINRTHIDRPRMFLHQTSKSQVPDNPAVQPWGPLGPFVPEWFGCQGKEGLMRSCHCDIDRMR